MQSCGFYDTDLYMRLSSADDHKSEKTESNSISNQRELILNFMKSHPELHLHKERIDDGFSGVDFNRPAFQDMMADIRAGKVNCVIVKDLSRFGRNFIEAGKYLQQIFPFMGVRFISINDNYDSLTSDPSTDSLLVPLKNLINDSYCRDTSVKIRSHLDVKRKNGECVMPFAVYGYKKDSENKHRLVIDEPAANIVRDIFNCKLGGLSLSAIADKLNREGVPSPMEYKRTNGCKMNCGFQINPRTVWTPVAIGRIIRNAVYTGRLEQGKRVRPNYKIKQSLPKDKEEWICTENAHDAIISLDDYRIANDLILSDTRLSPTSRKVYLFAGMLYCGDCRQSMVHRKVMSNGSKYPYYICSTYRQNSSQCTLHNISERAIIQTVEQAIQKHIQTLSDIQRILDYIETLPRKSDEAVQIDCQLESLRTELKRNEKFKLSAFEKYMEGKITEAMYHEYTGIYDRKCEDIRLAIEKRQQMLDDVINKHTPHSEWIDYFLQYKSIDHLDRMMLVKMVERIYVYEGKRIEIVFRHQSEYEAVLTYIEAAAGSSDGFKEVS